MRIVVLVKPVPEAETRLRPNAGGTALDGEGVKWVLAGYDESAVEQALLLKEAIPGSTVRALAFGVPARTEEVLRSALALGCDGATLAEAPADASTDALGTARVLAYALSKIPHDLVLAGKQAGDDEEGLVPSAVAELLGVPGFGFVTNLRWEPSSSRFTFDRSIEGGVERWAGPGPLVIGLQQAWNDPRTAKLPAILKSRKTPIERIPSADCAAALGVDPIPSGRPVSFRLPAPRTGAKLLEFKSPEDAAEQLVKILREEAKVFP